jgi:hypothetical protein
VTSQPSVDEIDPLDAFMAQNNEQISIENTQLQQNNYQNQLPEIVSGQDEEEEILQDVNRIEKEEIEYDSDGIPIASNSHGKSRIEPLAPIDHAQVHYPSFKKSFYSASQSVSQSTLATFTDAVLVRYVR